MAEESDVDGKARAFEHGDNNNENDSAHCTETGILFVCACCFC